MRIVWLTSRHPPDRGGMATSSQRLVNSLRDRDHDVFVVHFSGREDNHDYDQRLRLLTTGRSLLEEPERIFWLHKDVLQASVLVGFGGTQPGYYATLWSKWLNVSSVILLRGNDFDRTIHDLKKAWLTFYILNEADLVGTVSREMQKRIAPLRQGDTLFTPNSIDCSEWQLFKDDRAKADQWKTEHLASPKPVVGMFGELKFKKGLELTLFLFSSFQIREHATLLTVGNVSELMSEQLTHHCGDAWKQVPFQKREDMPLFYAVADIVFLPSYYDGMPNVLLEAMSLQKIVVASDSGAFPDVIEDGVNGFLFSSNDISSAAAALLKALHLSTEESDLIGRQARLTMERHFQPRMEADIIEKAIILLSEPRKNR